VCGLCKSYDGLLFRGLQMKHRTACEALGNLCAIQMYKDERKVGPCKVFKDYRRIPTSSDADRWPIPWLYYGEGDASIVLNRKKITAKYSIKPGKHVRTIFLYITFIVVFIGLSILRFFEINIICINTGI
jgi:hypothetical protein